MKPQKSHKRKTTGLITVSSNYVKDLSDNFYFRSTSVIGSIFNEILS